MDQQSTKRTKESAKSKKSKSSDSKDSRDSRDTQSRDGKSKEENEMQSNKQTKKKSIQIRDKTPKDQTKSNDARDCAMEPSAQPTEFEETKDSRPVVTKLKQRKSLMRDIEKARKGYNPDNPGSPPDQKLRTPSPETK